MELIKSILFFIICAIVAFGLEYALLSSYYRTARVYVYYTQDVYNMLQALSLTSYAFKTPISNITEGDTIYLNELGRYDEFKQINLDEFSFENYTVEWVTEKLAKYIVKITWITANLTPIIIKFKDNSIKYIEYPDKEISENYFENLNITACFPTIINNEILVKCVAYNEKRSKPETVEEIG